MELCWMRVLFKRRMGEGVGGGVVGCGGGRGGGCVGVWVCGCLALYTCEAVDEGESVDVGVRR